MTNLLGKKKLFEDHITNILGKQDLGVWYAMIYLLGKYDSGVWNDIPNL